MVGYVYSDLFHQGNVTKELKIQIGNITIGNDKIYQESFELVESLCSQEELKFGCCEASVVKLKIRNEFGDLQGKEMKISVILNGNTSYPFQIGKYKIDSCELSGDKKSVNVTAYDSMYDIINANVAKWYESLTFPITLKAFRDSFFSNLGITQESATLPQDNTTIEKTINTEKLSGSTVICAVCEINGVFGHIGRDGAFGYISLGNTNIDTTVKSYGAGMYLSCEFEEYNTSQIESVQIREEENDIGVIAGTTTGNRYVVEGNFLLYGKTESELLGIANAFLSVVKNVRYKPFKATVQGNPCVEVGDLVTFYTKTESFDSYVLERKLIGIQSLKDDFETKGSKEYRENVNSLSNDIKQLKGKSNVLERSIDETREIITDTENDLKAEITKNVNEITQTITETNKNLKDETDALKSSQSTLSQTVNDFKIEFEEKTNRVDEHGKEIEELKKTSYKFDTEDLTIEKTGSPLSTKINENGMRVLEDGDEVLVANNEGVDAKNLHATTYLIIGNNARFEDYQGDMTACFYIGG